MRMRFSTARKNIRPVRNQVVILALCLLVPSTVSLADIGSARQTELLYLLDHDCGSCHGMTRKGGLGSPLLPSVLAERSDDTLAAIILDGIPGTPMPPWRPLITVEETKWLIQVLRSKEENP